jgi:HlyD family secretion protein
VVTYTVIISAANPELLLYPGMTAMLRIAVSRREEVLKVPNEALRFHPPGTATNDGTAVWMLGADGRPTQAAVVTGLADDRSTEIRSGGLAERQPVIVGTADPPPDRGPLGIRLGF